jgi:hypothetical protein
VVAEMNLGQYVEVVRALAPVTEVVSVGRMDTDLVSPAQIVEEGGLL